MGSFIDDANEWLIIPEGADLGNFEGYELENGVPSHGPVGANVDTNVCSIGRQKKNSDAEEMKDVLEHAEENHGLDKKRLLGRDGTFFSGFWLGDQNDECRLARQNAHLAYMDPLEGDFNQCKLMKRAPIPGTSIHALDMSYVSTDKRISIGGVWPNFTRISGSQMGGEDGANDWTCNLGFKVKNGQESEGAEGGWAFGHGTVIEALTGTWDADTTQMTWGHRVHKPESPYGRVGGSVKTCMADYASRSSPCVDRSGSASTLTNCVGHSLGGGSCAAGKAMGMWDNIVGLNPTPSVTHSFNILQLYQGDDRDRVLAGDSFRYSFNKDIASWC